MRGAPVIVAVVLAAGCALPVTNVERSVLNPPASKLQRLFLLSRLHEQRIVPEFYSKRDFIADGFEKEFSKTLTEELQLRGVAMRVWSVPHLALDDTPPRSELEDFAPDAVMIVRFSDARVQWSGPYGGVPNLWAATIDVAVISPSGAGTIWNAKVQGWFTTIWAGSGAHIPASIAHAAVEKMVADGLLSPTATNAVATP